MICKRQKGKLIHKYIIQNGFDSNVFVKNSLISMYAKCSSIENACQFFDKMPERNVISWNAMIAGCVQSGHATEGLTLFHHMQMAEVSPDSVTMESLLQACGLLGALEEGKLIHNHIIKNGLVSDGFVGNSLLAMYARSGSLEFARQLFDKMTTKSLVAWNAMVAGCVQNGRAIEALILFQQMQVTDVRPDSITMVGMIQACALLATLEQGQCIHGYLIKSGFESSVFVGTSIIDMYAKHGNVDRACQAFNIMSKKDAISWNAMIGGYSQNGHATESLKLFYQMQHANVTPDSGTMVSVLQACAQLGSLEEGKHIHDYIVRSGLASNVFAGTALIGMYCKCGSVEFARYLFDNMCERNTASLNAMIAGYTQNGYANEALTLFHQMQSTNMRPGWVTMVSVLQACAHLGTLQEGKRIHGFIIRKECDSDVFVRTALIDMYCKCGSIDVARHLFDTIPERNVASWNAMISGYGMHGHGKDAIAMFSQMRQSCMMPDDITFICILSACSHAGFVDEGRQYFDCMSRDFDLKPRIEHYACMVDLLGRAGHLIEAYNFIKNMPLKPHVYVWGTLLGACRIHQNIELAKVVGKHIFDIDPDNTGYYILLSNICAASGKWDDVANIRALMEDKGLKKRPGYSLVEVNNKVHMFIAGDGSQNQSEEICIASETD